jgi:hypothetical protein
MSLTDAWEKKVLDLLFSNTALTIPATLFFALSTTTPGDDGSNFTEPSGNAYARVSVTNNTTNFPAATGTAPTTKNNGAAITFPTATGSWGTITHYAIFDASTAGNMLFWGQLTTAKVINTNDTASMNANDLAITLD